MCLFCPQIAEHLKFLDQILLKEYSERKEIILNYIIDDSGTPIKVGYL